MTAGHEKKKCNQGTDVFRKTLDVGVHIDFFKDTFLHNGRASDELSVY